MILSAVVSRPPRMDLTQVTGSHNSLGTSPMVGHSPQPEGLAGSYPRTSHIHLSEI